MNNIFRENNLIIHEFECDAVTAFIRIYNMNKLFNLKTEKLKTIVKRCYLFTTVLEVRQTTALRQALVLVV